MTTSVQGVGGPTYTYRQIDPEENHDGGAACGNIRQGFFFRTDRGLSFVDRPGATATTAVTVTVGLSGTQLTYSPGWIDPANPAFYDYRKPLAAEFVFKGRRLFIIANHFNSKTSDDPLFGHKQPPEDGSKTLRSNRAAIVNSFVDSLLASDPQAKIIGLGDLNEFEFSDTLKELKGTPPVLYDLIETLPLAERYT